MTDFAFQPVIILGAARSGTNALRDSLDALDGFGTWPCDEINPIWRHGNLGWPNDAIPPERAAGKPAAYIRNAFRRIWKERGRPDFVIEKTCANTLRVPFLDAVLPEARYLHIVRDGVDVVASAQKRWRGEMEMATLPYLLAKARYAPISDLPAYGWTFVKNRWAMMRTGERRMDIWGPRFADLDALRDGGASLDELCALQWVRSVDAADAALAAMPDGKAMTLRYEDFAAHPAAVLRSALDFLGTARDTGRIEAATAAISARSIGKGRAQLGGDADRLMEIMRATLIRHGYKG